jgi:hypothetical protein
MNAKQAFSTWYDISWMVDGLQVGKTEHDTEENGRKWGRAGGELGLERKMFPWEKENISKELLTDDLEALECKRGVVANTRLSYWL